MNLSYIGTFWDKHYKKLLWVTIIMLIIFGGVLGYSKYTTNEFIQKDFSLDGGLLITVQAEPTLSAADLETELQQTLGGSIHVIELRSISSGGSNGYIVELESFDNDAALSAISSALGITLQDNYTIEEVSSELGQSFLQSTIKAILVAFIVMSIVVFVYFREFIPSMAVILAGFSNLIGTLAIMNLLGMQLSTAAVAALLMVLGYSVDTDILLTTRLLRRHDGTLFVRLIDSMRTGLTMTAAAIVALGVGYIFSSSYVLQQMFLIILIGLVFDVIMTYGMNAGLLIWYLRKKKVEA